MKIIEAYPREIGFVLWDHCQNLLDDPRKIDLKLLLVIIIIEIDLLTKFCIFNVYFNVIICHLQMLLFSMALLHQLTPIGDKFVKKTPIASGAQIF